MRKNNNFTTFKERQKNFVNATTPRPWRVVLVCPQSRPVSVITNYTIMAAISHVRLCFLKSKLKFCWIGTLPWRKKLVLYLPLLTLARNKQGGGWDVSPVFVLKIDKKYHNFGKNCRACVHIWVLRVSWIAPVSRNLFCTPKLLIAHLHFHLNFSS